MMPLLVALIFLAGPEIPGAAINPYLDQAQKQYQSTEYEKALVELSKAILWPKTRDSDVAQIHLFRGLCQMQLGRNSAALAAFRAALTVDNSIRLPPLTSPRIVEVFETAARQLGLSVTEPKTPPRGEPEARLVPHLAPEVHPIAPSVAPLEQRQGAVREHNRWPAAVALAASAVALGMGAYFGLQAQDLESQSKQAQWGSDRAALNARAQKQATFTNTLLAGGVGAGIVGGAFVFLF